MGIFDPKVDAQFTPESIPQPEQNGALLGIAQAVGTVADGYFSTRKSGGSAGGSNTLDWAPVHEKMRDIADLRDQGLHRQAAQAEVQLQQLGQQAHFKVAGPEWVSAYETITGRPSEMIGEDPDSFLVSEAMEDTAGWTSAGYMSWARNPDPNLSPKEREDLTLSLYQKKAINATTQDLASLDWADGGREEATVSLMEDLSPITGLLNLASAHDRNIDLNDTVGAEQALLAIRGRYENALLKSNISEEERDNFLAPLINIEKQVLLASQVASYTGEKGIKSRLMSEVAQGIKQYPQAIQSSIINNMASSSSVVEALAVLSDDGSEGAMKAVGLIRDVMTEVFLDDEQRGETGGGNQTTAATAIEKMNATDTPIDESGVTSVLGPEFSGLTVFEIHERAMKITELLNTGMISTDDLELNRDLYITQGQFVASAVARGKDSQYFNANDIGKMYSGQTEAGIRALGKANPEFGWQAANANTDALRSQGSRARSDLKTQVQENKVWTSELDKDGKIKDVIIDREAIGTYLSKVDPSSAPEVMKFLDTHPDGITGVLTDPKYSSLATNSDLSPSVAIALRRIQNDLGTLTSGKTLLNTMDAITVIEDRTEAFRSMTKEFGLASGKIMDEFGGEVTGPTSGTPNATAGSVVEAGSGYTTIAMKDGSVVRREGTRAWRNNNPGNIEYGEFAKKLGAVGTDGRFAVFPTYEDGRNAKMSLLFETSSYKNLSITDAINRYAPPFENNTSRYTSTVAQAAGVPMSTRMSDLTDVQRELVLDAMERVEGFKPGTETTEDGVTTQASSPNTPSEVTSQPISEDVAGDAMTAITETADTGAPTSSPTPESRPDASVIPPEMQRLFEEGGSGFTGEQAKEALEKNKFLDESIRTLSASQVEGIIRALVAG
jgi:hypothetical protein